MICQKQRMKLLIFVMVIELSTSAEIHDSSTCTTFPCLIFNDDFNFLDLDVWGHEITMAGGGNGEFQIYVNNRSVTYTRNGSLFIKPNLVSDWKSEKFLYEDELDIFGLHGRNQRCSSNAWSGCFKKGTSTEYINPVMSGRLNTLGVFSFKYGKVEVRAKFPRGAWLWPALWLLPENFAYGEWPSSGEINIAEARGNDVYGALSNRYAGSTLHWGPYIGLNRYLLTHKEYQTSNGQGFYAKFHTWTIVWNCANVTTYLDGRQQLFIDPITNFWDHGKFSRVGDIDNPWEQGGKMAPFDQKFFLIVNLAVGGTGGYFPDDVHPAHPAKPWKDRSKTAKADFWSGRHEWLPTWGKDGKISEEAALKVDFVRVYKMSKADIDGC